MSSVGRVDARINVVFTDVADKRISFTNHRARASEELGGVPNRFSRRTTSSRPEWCRRAGVPTDKAPATGQVRVGSDIPIRRR